MSSSNIVRWGGLAAVIAGLVWSMGFVLSRMPAGQSPLPEHVGYVSWVTPLLFAAVALIGLHARLADASPRLGRVGVIMAYITVAASLVTIGALLLFRLRVLPQPAGTGAFVAFFGLLFSAIVLGIAALRANVLPRWASGLPLAIGLLTIPSLFLLRPVWGIIIGLAWVALGYALLKGRRTEVPSPTHTA